MNDIPIPLLRLGGARSLPGEDRNADTRDRPSPLPHISSCISSPRLTREGQRCEGKMRAREKRGHSTEGNEEESRGFSCVFWWDLLVQHVALSADSSSRVPSTKEPNQIQCVLQHLWQNCVSLIQYRKLNGLTKTNPLQNPGKSPKLNPLVAFELTGGPVALSPWNNSRKSLFHPSIHPSTEKGWFVRPLWPMRLIYTPFLLFPTQVYGELRIGHQCRKGLKRNLNEDKSIVGWRLTHSTSHQGRQIFFLCIPLSNLCSKSGRKVNVTTVVQEHYIQPVERER